LIDARDKQPSCISISATLVQVEIGIRALSPHKIDCWVCWIIRASLRKEFKSEFECARISESVVLVSGDSATDGQQFVVPFITTQTQGNHL
jgi:hypothetical protein